MNKPIEDLSFQQPSGPVQDVIEVCQLATTLYKNTEYPSQVQPMVVNLLAQVSKETLMLAIQNVSQMCENNNTAHNFRKGFAKQFSSVQAVKEMAERSIAPVDGEEW